MLVVGVALAAMVFTLYVRVVLPSGPANFVLAMEMSYICAILWGLMRAPSRLEC